MKLFTLIIVLIGCSAYSIKGQRIIIDDPTFYTYGEIEEFFPNKLDSLSGGTITLYLLEADSLIKKSPNSSRVRRFVSSSSEKPEHSLIAKAVYLDKNLIIIQKLNSDSSFSFVYFSKGFPIFESYYSSNNIIEEEAFDDYTKYYNQQGTLTKIRFYSWDTSRQFCTDSIYLFHEDENNYIKCKQYFTGCKKSGVWEYIDRQGRLERTEVYEDDELKIK